MCNTHRQDLTYINDLPLITPTWPEKPNIFAATTTRLGGISQPPFESLNLGLASGDNRDDVLANRELLFNTLSVPKSVLFLNQIHSNITVRAIQDKKKSNLQSLSGIGADGTITSSPGVAPYILTADCLPILIAHKEGREVAALHAGWKSLLTGIIEDCVAQFRFPKEEYDFWLGPAISEKAFEVGPEVVASFEYLNQRLRYDSETIGPWHRPSERENHFYADIYALAKIRLSALGIPLPHIYGGDFCTLTDNTLFHSYRRDGKHSGRIASLIWIKEAEE